MPLIGKSSEDYLETILMLEKQNGFVRSIDIATAKNVSRPSVNRAVNNLKSLGLVNQESYGDIYLTSLGRDKALEIMRKHNLLKYFLQDVLKVSPEVSEKDACQMEHFLSEETMIKLENFLEEYSPNYDQP